MAPEKWDFFDWLDRVDRRIIYGFVMLALLIPIVWGKALPPAKMESARKYFETIDSLESRDDRIVFLALDWGPSTQAENGPQTEATMEQLMRKRVKFALVSYIYMAEPFMRNMPRKVADRLEAESRAMGKNEKWEYGKDWVNIGYKPGMQIILQQVSKTEDIRDVFKTDANGELLKNIPCMQKISRFEQIPMLAEFTGMVGVFNLWVQFFQSEKHRPKMVHGCTSITIPEAYIYLDSGQLSGLLEGVAGAAYYSKLLGYTAKKPNAAMKNMTALSVAHFVIIFFIFLGNLGMFIKQARARNARN